MDESASNRQVSWTTRQCQGVRYKEISLAGLALNVISVTVEKPLAIVESVLKISGQDWLIENSSRLSWTCLSPEGRFVLALSRFRGE